ncbi:amidohydrolase family protein [Psychroflexus sp. CAK1W]|uniref:amidohydrolase family protein n=1 Tax=Psychroflexus curvus TaxID=2873595 RepID=UPI001CCC949F|nr:amidohydrolase family protein [Psychroflexus curvus]MBZ9628818.1 amidohydrolase family protein [Psychroflexus curvus]
MKTFSLLFLPLLLIIFISCNNAENTNPEYIVYKGATLFDGNGKKIENSVIVIKEGTIEAAGDENTAIPDNAEIIDVEGKFITPGLIDAHVHLSATGLFDTRPGMIKEKLVDSLNYLAAKAWTKNNIEKYYEAYLRTGVTAVYDNGGSPWTITLQESAETNLNAPHVAAAGPLITPAPERFVKSINPPVEKEMVRLTSDSLGQKVVQYNTYLGSTGIKIWRMSLDDSEFMANLKAVAEEVQNVGNKMIVHVSTLEEAKAALELGAKLLVHGVNDKIVDSEFVELIKNKNALYTPTTGSSDLWRLAMMALLGEKVEINDLNKVVDERTLRFLNNPEEYISDFDTLTVQEYIDFSLSKEYRKSDSLELANLKKLWDAGVTITVGTDAGIPGSMHGISYYNELEEMQKAGIPPAELIIMATRNGAMAMERLDDIGTLEKGKMADLIILEKDPSEDISNIRSITHVMRGGLLRPVNEKFN